MVFIKGPGILAIIHFTIALCYVYNIYIYIRYASTQPHTYAYGGAAQLEVGSLPVSVSRPSALLCSLCLTHCSPGNVPNPTPGPLMDITLCQNWSATLYRFMLPVRVHFIIDLCYVHKLWSLM